MKFGVVVFPGSNCDEDLVYSMSNIMGQEVVKLWHKERDLQGCDFVFVPGGFSYGDYLRSGAIARFSPIMDEVVAHANRGGYVMGICNGFQILTESGLLPGALLRNTNIKFNCKNVNLTPGTTNSQVTNKLADKQVIQVPIAHGEGRFYCDDTTLAEIESNNQVIFRYCDAEGNLTPESNPNGSLNNIAGITNAGRNVYGMMPHPERCAADYLLNADGKLVFEGLLSV